MFINKAGHRIPITPEEQAAAEKISRERSATIIEMMIERRGIRQRLAATERMAAGQGQVLTDE